MLANPLTWVVLAILLLTVAVAGLILYWDEFKAAFGDTWWGAAIIDAVQGICQWWEKLTAALSDGRWGDALMATLDMLLAPLRSLGDGIAWVGEKLGLSGGPQVDFTNSGTATAMSPSSVAALEAPRRLAAPSGFAASQIAGAMTQNNGKSVSIGSVTINPEQLEEWGWLW